MSGATAIKYHNYRRRREAPRRCAYLKARYDSDLLGFSIVGAGAGAGYLQRNAVAPSVQHRGIGRALVRASLRWARQHGARQMLLNTLGNNDAASNLYLTEGFTHLDDRLAILRGGST